jgi:pyruvate dehydrogenase E2 component (dihydrolipoamide acetyltransferase)
MTDGQITEWLVKEGDRVDEGDVILSAETDKAVQEIQSTATGRIAKLLVKEGEVAVCQAPLLIMAEEGEDISALLERVGADAIGDERTSPVAGAAATPLGTDTVNTVRTGGRPRISPLARKTAAEYGIDESILSPVEPGARIVQADVFRFVEEHGKPDTDQTGSRTGGAPRRVPHSAVRKVIAERMQRSNAEIPRAVLTASIVAHNLLAAKANRERRGEKISLNSFVTKAVARALAEQPELNSRWTPDAVEILPEIDIGIAVDTERGLMVPVIRGADTKTVVEIDLELKEKAERARAGTAQREEISGSTFTVTNLGVFGIENFIPVVNPPECGILAIGAVTVQPVWSPTADRFEPVEVLKASLAFDHRIVDGAPAARFLRRVKELIEADDDAETS